MCKWARLAHHQANQAFEADLMPAQIVVIKSKRIIIFQYWNVQPLVQENAHPQYL